MKKLKIQNSKFKINPKSQQWNFKNAFSNLSFVIGISFVICHLSFVICSAQDLTSKELIIKAREFQAERDYDSVFKYTNECIERFSEEAKREQWDLGTAAQPQGKEELYQALNDVATGLFIQGEVYLEQAKLSEAKSIFESIIKEYPSGYAWDPRGWFYSLSEKSRDSLNKIENKPAEEKPQADLRPNVSMLKTEISLYDLGTEEIVDYEKYGEFKGIGTKDYQYKVLDQDGLSRAVGEGIYPNTSSVRWNPRFSAVNKEKRLAGSHWDFIHSPDREAAFFKWAMAPEPAPVKLFYTALVLEKSGRIKHAIKAYYAILAHFPRAIGWTYWHTPWYIGQAAIYKIKYLLRNHPELNLRLADARIRVINGFDKDINNDIIEVNPGRLQALSPWIERLERYKKILARKMAFKKVKKAVGSGKVRLAQYANGHWQLLLDNKPYQIRGITYSPVKVGQSPDNGTLTNWMDYDFNQNGKSDGPYDAFVDKNNNNQKDGDEPVAGDFELMKQMGVNTIRLYHQPFGVKKELLRDLYEHYGIRVIMGDFLGKYALGSGASWYEGTDYKNPGHKKNMLDSVLKMVAEHKDEPYILFWLLGNENVYGVGCNADKDPEAFFKFVNEVARAIKQVDENHPVAIASGDTLHLDVFAKYCPDVDIFGANAYRGDYGFGDFWQAVYDEADKPAFVTEYGCSAYNIMEDDALGKGEDGQLAYHKAAWEDVLDNSFAEDGYGNAVGAVAFEWLDEWWKAYEPSIHDIKRLWAGPFPDGYMHEEWLGLAGQRDGSASPYLRQLRKSYYLYKEMWGKK